MVEDKKIRKPEKGLNLRIQEAKEGIADVINKSLLPPGVLLMILNEFAGQMQMQNARMIETERKAWEEGVKNGQSVQ